MIEPHELARLAVANKLPEISSPDALPAIRSAMDRITGLRIVGGALSTRKPGSPCPSLDPIIAALSAIGAKLAPLRSSAEASAWLDAIMLSLSKYTARAAQIAAETAATERFPYGLGSVDARLHELAQEAEGRDRAAIARLRMLARQIERAMTQKALPAPDDTPITVEDIAAMPDHIISMGRTGGFISDEEYQAAMALRDQNPINKK
jgi:hypothetical protein